MKNSFKSLIIVFLVALLGSFVGGYGAFSLYTNNNPTPNENTNTPIVTTYQSAEKSLIKDAIKKAYETVVEISVEKQSNYHFLSSSSTSKGSGVIISEDGYIITNHHVVNGGDKIIVTDSNGIEYEAVIIGLDSKTDLAVIKIDAHNLKSAKFADSDNLEIGDTTIVIGNPLGNGISASDGIISALDKRITIDNETMSLIQTNAAVNQGNSGGGLFNINGELIGVVNAKSSNISTSVSVEGLGYAIPSNTVKKISEDIIANGYVKNRPTLGVKIAEISVDQQGFPKGVYITEVIDGGASQKAGLQTYDRIIQLEEDLITTYNELSLALSKYNIGDEIKIKVIRNQKELEFTLVLQENIQTDN